MGEPATRIVDRLQATRMPPAPVAPVLADRGRTHGDFGANAAIAQTLKEVLRASPSWGKMLPVEREALDMMMLKISRIGSGDPHYADHWLDIEGYARLCRERLPGGGK